MVYIRYVVPAFVRCRTRQTGPDWISYFDSGCVLHTLNSVYMVVTPRVSCFSAKLSPRFRFRIGASPAVGGYLLHASHHKTPRINPKKRQFGLRLD